MNDNNTNKELRAQRGINGSLYIKQNKEPQLKKPVFLVDGKLDDKLDEYEITKLMNKSNFTLFCSKSGGGKTTMIVSFLNTSDIWINK